MLLPNMTITTEQGNSLTILKQIGTGSRAEVYAISVNGSDKPKALKWFRNSEDRWNKQIFENTRKLSKVNAPAPSMIWIEDTVVAEDGFGYVLSLRPSGYIPLTKILFNPNQYSNRIACTCAMDYLRAMYNTHNQGLLFFAGDGINDCYFYPKSGHLLISNCERIAYLSDPLTTSGSLARYTAPELITGKTMQNRAANRFSLALILFLILFRGHPLEGKATMLPCITPSSERFIYGEHPVFIFDPKDDSNRPVKKFHKNVEYYWSSAPDYLKAIFEKAFSWEALHNPNMRPSERDFEEVLLRYMNNLNSN